MFLSEGAHSIYNIQNIKFKILETKYPVRYHNTHSSNFISPTNETKNKSTTISLRKRKKNRVRVLFISLSKKD